MGVELAVVDQQALGLDGFHQHASAAGVGSDPRELSIAGAAPIAAVAFDKAIADLGREHKGVVDVFPICASENERLQILLHIGEDLAPVAGKGGVRPEMRMELHVFDPPDVPGALDENAAPQHASVDLKEPMPAVLGRAGPNAVITVDKRDVLNRAVEADLVRVGGIGPDVDGPGIGPDFVHLLLGIIDRDPLYGSGAAHFDEGRT